MIPQFPFLIIHVLLQFHVAIVHIPPLLVVAWLTYLTSCCSLACAASSQARSSFKCCCIASFSHLISLMLCMICCTDGCLSPPLLLVFLVAIDSSFNVAWDLILRRPHGKRQLFWQNIEFLLPKTKMIITSLNSKFMTITFRSKSVLSLAHGSWYFIYRQNNFKSFLFSQNRRIF